MLPHANSHTYKQTKILCFILLNCKKKKTEHELTNLDYKHLWDPLPFKIVMTNIIPSFFIKRSLYIFGVHYYFK